LDTVWTIGVGFTVKIIDSVTPLHAFEMGVTEIKLLIVILDVLTAVNAGIFPIPVVPKPTAELLLVHS
jgi:hypothetical protein